MSPRRRGRGHGPRPTASTVVAAPGLAESPIVDAAAGEVAVAPSRSEPRLPSATPAAPRRPSSDVRPPRETAPRWQPKPLPQTAPEPPLEPVGTAEARSSCTLAQMRRFIKSRPYVPVHELRRRFLIEGIEDEVSPMPSGTGTLFVGLPEREAGFLGELVKAGEVGCELLLDPTSPGVIGVYPMRPVARQ